MRILFVTRKFPPSVGGMETAAEELYKALGEQADVTLIKWGGSNKWFLLVYPWLAVRALIATLRHNYDAIYLQDGLLSLLGWLITRFKKIPTVITVHGLEVAYSSWQFRQLPWYLVIRSLIYRYIAWPLVLRPCLQSISQVVAISDATKKAFEVAIGNKKVQVISNGVRDEYYLSMNNEGLLGKLVVHNMSLAKKLKDKKIILTVGRLVPRKGAAWFVSNVMTQLVKDNADYVYVIVGTGPDQALIETLVKRYKMSNNVILTGYASPFELQVLYNLASAFIMPNIPESDDMEGFGLVAIEASSCGTPVVAAKLQGIPDAVIEGETGYLVEAQNVAAFIEAIKNVTIKRLLQPLNVRTITLHRYSWQASAAAYVKVVQQLQKFNSAIR